MAQAGTNESPGGQFATNKVTPVTDSIACLIELFYWIFQIDQIWLDWATRSFNSRSSSLSSELISIFVYLTSCRHRRGAAREQLLEKLLLRYLENMIKIYVLDTNVNSKIVQKWGNSNGKWTVPISSAIIIIIIIYIIITSIVIITTIIIK